MSNQMCDKMCNKMCITRTDKGIQCVTKCVTRCVTKCVTKDWQGNSMCDKGLAREYSQKSKNVFPLDRCGLLPRRRQPRVMSTYPNLSALFLKIRKNPLPLLLCQSGNRIG